MKTKERLIREIEILKRHLSKSDQFAPIPELFKSRINELYWVLEICQECGKDISKEQKSGSEDICDECYKKIDVQEW